MPIPSSLFGGGMPGFTGGSASSSAGAAGAGGYWSLGDGAWNVNLGGSGGPATQLPALSPPLLLLLGVGAWLLLRGR